MNCCIIYQWGNIIVFISHTSLLERCLAINEGFGCAKIKQGVQKKKGCVHKFIIKYLAVHG